MLQVLGLILFGFFSTPIGANPYPDPKAVPVDAPEKAMEVFSGQALEVDFGIPVLRVTIDWDDSEMYRLGSAMQESSGTKALLARCKTPDPHGSYRAILRSQASGKVLGYGAIGTGKEYRRLSRSLTFRFPLPEEEVEIEMWAENPSSGIMESVFRQNLAPSEFGQIPLPASAPEVRLLQAARTEKELAVNIYADGYQENGRDKFFAAAQRVVSALRGVLPRFEQLTFRAVFQVSRQALGSAKPLGLPVPERDSFLGLYFPYWWNLQARWYHVVYPTREERFRRAVALVPYDYPIVLMDSADYWGVGNFNEMTAIPAGDQSFTYLLLHEFGHFLGLNEEYGGGGPTELEFAPGITEPWSQNISFSLNRAFLKWRAFIEPSTPIPTPHAHWQSAALGPWGAYRGGYADSAPRGKSHIPGLSCIMNSGARFCPVCQHALGERIAFDLGE